MRPDYKNWMPKGMILGLAAGTAACAVVGGLAYGLMDDGQLKTVLTLAADAGIIAGAGMTAWCLSLYSVSCTNAPKPVQAPPPGPIPKKVRKKLPELLPQVQG